jgi:hypothetical protein
MDATRYAGEFDELHFGTHVWRIGQRSSFSSCSYSVDFYFYLGRGRDSSTKREYKDETKEGCERSRDYRSCACTIKFCIVFLVSDYKGGQFERNGQGKESVWVLVGTFVVVVVVGTWAEETGDQTCSFDEFGVRLDSEIETASC